MARMGLEKGGSGAVGHAANGALLALNRQMATFVAGAGAYFGFQSVVSGAADFQSQLTAIQKKAGTTAEQTRRIGEEALALANSGELAVSIEEIMSAFERGAAAGIPLDQLSEFARLSAMAADAFEMAAEDVANAAAGFKVGLGIDMSEMEAYFGLINKLADSGIADEAGIINFLDRAGAQLSKFGVTAEQAAAYASTLASIKMPPETAARMMNTLTSKLLSPGSKQAKVALKGIVGNVGEFHKLLKHDANKALEFFLQKVGALDKFKSAELLTGLLGQGFSDEVLRLAGAYEELQRNQAVATDRKSWENSLPETYKLKLDDFWSQFELLKNAFATLKINLGDMALPGLTSGLGSAIQLVKDIDEGLAAFKANVDTTELDKAGQAVSELAGKIDELLSMGSEDSALVRHFRNLAGPVNAVAEGINLAKNAAQALGLAEPDGESAEDVKRRVKKFADHVNDTRDLILPGSSAAIDYITDLVKDAVTGEGGKAEAGEGGPSPERFGRVPGQSAPEPIAERLMREATPEGEPVSTPKGERLTAAPDGTSSLPAAPATADVQAYLAAMGQAEQAKLRVEQPIVTDTGLNTAAFMAGLAAMESAAIATAERINRALGSISAPSVSPSGGRVGVTLRSHLGDGAN